MSVEKEDCEWMPVERREVEMGDTEYPVHDLPCLTRQPTAS